MEKPGDYSPDEYKKAKFFHEVQGRTGFALEAGGVE